MGIRSGEASVTAGAAAVSAPSGPDCGGGRRWRGQGTAAEGEGSEKAQRRGGAGARTLVEGRWGRRSCQGGGKSRECVQGASEGVLPRLWDRCCDAPWGPTVPYPGQFPTLDVFILAAPTGSAPSTQWETLPAQ